MLVDPPTKKSLLAKNSASTMLRLLKSQWWTRYIKIERRCCTVVQVAVDERNKEQEQRTVNCGLPFEREIGYFLCYTERKRKYICCMDDDDEIRKQTDCDRQCPRLIPNI